MSSTSPGAPEGELDSTPADITGAVVSGVKWKVATQLVNEGGRVIMVIVLARLLTPHDLGVAGMALVAATFVTVFADPALGITLIQRPTITERDRCTVFWTTLGVGLVATLLGIALSGAVAGFFGVSEVASLFAVLSTTFTIIAVGSTQRALLLRSLNFKALQLREIGAALVGFCAAIALAFAGFGAWAVIGNSVVAALTSTALLWKFSSWRPSLTYSRDSLHELGTFGGSVFLARIFQWANLSADNMLVGRFLGASALGAYALAYNVMFLPMTRLAIPLQQVLSPAYSRMQDDLPRLEAAWLRSKRLIVGMLAPGFLLTLVVAPDLIPVVFGAKWDNAIVPLQFLCLAGLAHALVTLDWSILQARGKGGTLLRLYAFLSVVTVASFVIGLAWGIVGVAACYAVAKWVLYLPDTWITTRGVSFGFWPAVRASLAPLPLAAAGAAAAFGVREASVAADIRPLVRILLAGGTMVAVYLGLVLLIAPSLVAEARRALFRGKGRPRPVDDEPPSASAIPSGDGA